MGRKRTGSGNDERRIVLDDAWLRDCFNEGKTAKEIAELRGCSTHPVKVAMRRLGLRRPAARRLGVGAGANNPSWKGGRRVRPDGYVVVWTPDGERLEHQVAMEEHLGRKLRPGEVVHHLNELKGDNRPKNLSLTTQNEHIREHLPAMHKARYGK